MCNDEDINTWHNRVEKLHYKLYSRKTRIIDKLESEAKIILETLKRKTLAVFIEGLIELVKNTIKTGRPSIYSRAGKTDGWNQGSRI